eukprot:Gb_02604 [translate_table: standard]
MLNQPTLNPSAHLLRDSSLYAKDLNSHEPTLLADLSCGGAIGGAPDIGKPCWELNVGFQTLLRWVLDCVLQCLIESCKPNYCGICMHNITVRTDMISELGIVLAWPCLDGIDVDCESLGLTARRRGLATHGTPRTSMKVVLTRGKTYAKNGIPQEFEQLIKAFYGNVPPKGANTRKGIPIKHGKPIVKRHEALFRPTKREEGESKKASMLLELMVTTFQVANEELTEENKRLKERVKVLEEQGANAQVEGINALLVQPVNLVIQSAQCKAPPRVYALTYKERSLDLPFGSLLTITPLIQFGAERMEALYDPSNKANKNLMAKMFLANDLCRDDLDYNPNLMMGSVHIRALLSILSREKPQRVWLQPAKANRLKPQCLVVIAKSNHLRASSNTAKGLNKKKKKKSTPSLQVSTLEKEDTKREISLEEASQILQEKEEEEESSVLNKKADEDP